MNQNHIATIRLAQGQMGWFDNLSDIKLTKANPVATLYKGSNLANVKKAVKEGKVTVIEYSVSTLFDMEVFN